MFGIFNRNKLKNWETELLLNIFFELPEVYLQYTHQIKNGLLKGVILNASDIPGYVAFTYNYDIFKKYDNEKEHTFKLTNIKVYDYKSSSFVPYEIYFSSGKINGYSLCGLKNYKIDVNKVDVSGFRKEILGESDYAHIINILSDEEKLYINPADIYSVFVNDKEYFHIKDLEDGDFVGIDIRKTVYKITHDPLAVVALNKELKEILKDLK